jgi:hypothetical protein
MLKLRLCTVALLFISTSIARAADCESQCPSSPPKAKSDCIIQCIVGASGQPPGGNASIIRAPQFPVDPDNPVK